MQLTWNLRMLCAQKGLWTGASLNRRLREKLGLSLTSQTLSNLMSKQPKRVSMNLLLALCAALDCTPNDLLVIDTTVTQASARRLVEEIVSANQPRAPRRRKLGGRKRISLAPPTRI
jgi:DNA-binding Xre family transcriptional regulator